MNNRNNLMPIGLAQEIARQGEARLTALMNLATAADLRATTLCGIFGAASVGIGAAVLTYLSSEHPLLRLVLAGFISCFCLFIAAGYAAVAGAPRNFYIAGGNPDNLRQWAWDGNKWREEIEMLDATAQRYAESINKNQKILEDGSKRINYSLALGGVAPLLGLGVYIVAPCFGAN